MSSYVSVTIAKKILPYSDVEIEYCNSKIKLHEFQKAFYIDVFDERAPSIIFVTAPTGAGKTYSFALPIKYAKDHGYYKSPRGLIIAPTNALVEDIKQKLSGTVDVGVLTSRTIKSRGRERGWEIINKVRKLDLIVTNPDIVNFLLHGGYHSRGDVKFYIPDFPDWSEFIAKFDYVVLDEYHLYDEEQIADIIAAILLAELFKQKGINIKWFFVSATKEEVTKSALERALKKAGLNTKIASVEQKLGNSGRVIQGKQIIKFTHAKSLYDFLFDKDMLRDNVCNEIENTTANGGKTLILFNSLRDAIRAEELLKRALRDTRIGRNTGLETRAKNYTLNLDDYDVVISTSKLEVGVDYDVQLAFIEPGYTLYSFLQRIGRVGRKTDCKIYCVVDVVAFDVFGRLDGKEVDYYSFVSVAERAFRNTRKRVEAIENHLGAVLWSMTRSLEGIKVKAVRDIASKFEFFNILEELDREISAFRSPWRDFEMSLKSWWSVFVESFRRFRPDTQTWTVLYDGMETEYDIIWVLENTYISNIDVSKKVIEIAGGREKKEKVVRGIETRSLLSNPRRKIDCDKYISYICDKDWEMFKRRVYIGDIYEKNLDRWIANVRPPENLEKLLRKLKNIYTKKRIDICNIILEEDYVKSIESR